MWRRAAYILIAVFVGVPHASAQPKQSAPAFEADVETTYIIANGQPISRQGHIYRSSRGVVREDSGLGSTITDVNAGTVTILVSATKEAHVVPIPQDQRAAIRPSDQPPTQVYEDTSIDGHPVKKMRRTSVNGQQQDVWTATDLGIVMRSQVDAPGFSRVRELRNISTAEPDPVVFQVPSDYKVVEEKMTARPGDVSPPGAGSKGR